MSRMLADPDVLVSSSDAGAHMQMLCASGDSTLLLTRHVRERGDFTLEEAVHELTGRQSEAFGFTGRGVLAGGNVADLVVFALDELHYDTDEFVHDLPRRRPPATGRRRLPGHLRRRRAVQLDGKLTGELPGGSSAPPSDPAVELICSGFVKGQGEPPPRDGPPAAALLRRCVWW